MRNLLSIVMVTGVGLALAAGCRSDGNGAAGAGASEPRSSTPRTSAPASSEPRQQPARPPAAQPSKPYETLTTKPAKAPARAKLTSTNNPTTLAGRGAPSLDAADRPAAWVYVDGKAGTFVDHEGQPQLQGVIDQPIGRSPTIRVEAYDPLLGTPRDLKYLLRTVESADGNMISYAVSSYDGTFEVGREYSLLNPGENFVVRNWHSGDEVRQIAPLSPGTYMIAATVANRDSNKSAAAVTYFTVGHGK